MTNTSHSIRNSVEFIPASPYQTLRTKIRDGTIETYNLAVYLRWLGEMEQEYSPTRVWFRNVCLDATVHVKKLTIYQVRLIRNYLLLSLARKGVGFVHCHLDEIFQGATIPFKYLSLTDIQDLRKTTTPHVWDCIKLVQSKHLITWLHVPTTQDSSEYGLDDSLDDVEALQHIPFLRYNYTSIRSAW